MHLILLLLIKIYLKLTASVIEDEANISRKICHDKMRMEIKVHQKRHHSHYHKNQDNVSTIDRKSNHAGVSKGYTKSYLQP